MLYGISNEIFVDWEALVFKFLQLYIHNYIVFSRFNAGREKLMLRCLALVRLPVTRGSRILQ